MKKETILKILKYLGVACIGAFIGMGALIGVSSCSSQGSKNLTSIKASADTSPYYIYQTKENGFMNEQYNYGDYGEEFYFSGNPQIYVIVYSLNVKNEEYSQYHYIKQFFDVSGSGGSSSKNIVLWGLGFSNISEMVSDNSDILFFYEGRQNITYTNVRDLFYFSDVTYVRTYALTSNDGVVTNQIENGSLYYYFNQYGQAYDGVLPHQYTFTFNDKINYNGPLNLTMDMPYIDYQIYGLTNPYIFTLNLPDFVVNGQLFNRIDLLYVNANGYRFDLPNSEQYELISSNNYITFSDLYFINTHNNPYPSHQINGGVNTRTSSLYRDANGGVQVYLMNESHWISPDYLTIEFLSAPNQQQLSILNTLNENVYGYNENNVNVGLNNVFNLFTLAFTSWLPIFAIEVIPGITIGLLMFMPLVVGIILTVIWLVKR